MKSKFKTSLGIFIITILIVGLHFLGWLRPIEVKVRGVFNPVIHQFYRYSFDDLSFSLDSKSNLKQKNIKLRRKLAKQQIKKSKIKALKRENNKLKQTLNFYKKKNYTEIGAKVIGKDIQQISETILINKGSSSGIEKGDPVIFLDGALIGKIAQVNKKSSIVRLLYDSKARVAGTILNKDISIGMIQGGLGVNIQMKYIPQNEQITIGDKIITSGLSKQIPYGLVIGTVKSVKQEPDQPFQKAEIAPVLDLNKVNIVTVITSL